MSHQSGIPVANSLKDSFGTARMQENKRYIKVQIVNDEMMETASKPASGAWDADLKFVQDALEPNNPCYILFRLDSKGPNGTEWVLFCYVPDKAKVKDKMVYASSRATLKLQLGSQYFSEDIFGTVLSDFNKDGYESYVRARKSEAPLTESELMKRSQIESGEGILAAATSTTYVHGISFPVDAAASDAVKKLVNGGCTYVQVKLDMEHEMIKLDHVSNITAADIAKEIHTSEPRFHFFGYNHEFEGRTDTSFVYIYSCPDGSEGTKGAPVKMRMLYSSSKAAVSEILTHSGRNPSAKLEIGTPSDIDEDVIFQALHPQKEEKKAAFARPLRPGRGPAKLHQKK